MSAEQDKLLSAIEDEGTARVLAEIWKQIEGEPLAAARMLRAFAGAKSAIDDMLRDIPQKWEQLETELTKADLHRARFLQDMMEFKSSTSKEMAGALENVKQLYEFFEKVDSDKFLNKANQLLDLCDRIGKAKRDGTLETLRALLPPSKP